jgi:sirohydrochlorin cobaltochelatase
VKTIIVIAAHGAPATDCPRRKIGMLMALESLGRLVSRVGLLRMLEKTLDRQVRCWPRTAENDPYKAGVEALAGRIAAHTGCEVIPGYNEFCAPDIGAAIDAAIARGAARVIVATTMTTRGGEHSETEIREIVEAAAKRHAPVQVLYAWPFDPDRVARLFADEITGILSRQFR